MFNPKYRITDKILSNLTKISEIKSLVEKSNITPAREIYLKKAAAIGMAHSSTSIEGNTLDEYQVRMLADGEKVIAEDKQILEVENYLKSLKLVDKIYESKKSFDKIRALIRIALTKDKDVLNVDFCTQHVIFCLIEKFSEKLNKEEVKQLFIRRKIHFDLIRKYLGYKS